MQTKDWVLLIAAFGSAIGVVIGAVLKGVVPLLKVVSHKVDDSKTVVVEDVEDLKKVLKLEMAKIQNEVSMITAKLTWTENAPEKTKKVMDAAIEKMKSMNESQKTWLTSELVRITEKTKGDKDEG